MYESIESLFRQEYARLVRALTVATGNEELATDAVQDAFVQASRHWDRICEYDEPARWLRRVAVNRIANEKRRVRRRDAGLVRLGSDRLAREADVARAPDEAAGGSLLDLRVALAALPERQRLVICLYHLADLGVHEVAHLLDISPGTVKSQLHDARKNLFRTMEVHDG